MSCVFRERAQPGKTEGTPGRRRLQRRGPAPVRPSEGTLAQVTLQRSEVPSGAGHGGGPAVPTSPSPRQSQLLIRATARSPADACATAGLRSYLGRGVALRESHAAGSASERGEAAPSAQGARAQCGRATHDRAGAAPPGRPFPTAAAPPGPAARPFAHARPVRCHSLSRLLWPPRAAEDPG